MPGQHATHYHEHNHDGHDHDHDHEHGHSHSHNHAMAHRLDKSKLGFAFKVGLAITLAFVVIEFVFGLLSNSLALISDAGHNLSDGLALGFSWVAVVLAQRAPNARRTYGFHRAGILAASLNSLTLVLIAAYIIIESVQRLFQPAEVQSWTVVAVAGIALVVNLAVAGLLHGWSHGDLNARSAFIHVATDAVASLGVIIAAVGQALTGWQILDPLISLLIALLILWSGWGILKESTQVLLEGTPEGLNIEQVTQDLQTLAGVSAVHDLHVWTIGSDLPALSCHLLMSDNSSLQQVTRTIQTANQLLEQKYNIRHSTIQVECQACNPCEMQPALEIRSQKSEVKSSSR